jgi:hypothetical protein
VTKVRGTHQQSTSYYTEDQPPIEDVSSDDGDESEAPAKPKGKKGDSKNAKDKHANTGVFLTEMWGMKDFVADLAWTTAVFMASNMVCTWDSSSTDQSCPNNHTKLQPYQQRAQLEPRENRCFDDTRGNCHDGSCTRPHAKFDKQSSIKCSTFETPGT